VFETKEGYEPFTLDDARQGRSNSLFVGMTSMKRSTLGVTSVLTRNRQVIASF